MNPKVLFIGSIGVVAETSELQRQAYNHALKESGLDWEWSLETYKELLQSNGGKDRLKTLANATKQVLSEDLIQKIHTRKTEIACNLIVDHKVKPRPGVVQKIEEAKSAGVKVAWVTSTYEANTNAILQASGGALQVESFDRIFHRHEVSTGKPSPEIYQLAMEYFDVLPTDCIAFEDSLTSILAAKGAGIFTMASLGAFHSEHVENIADMFSRSLDAITWQEITAAYENHSKLRRAA